MTFLIYHGELEKENWEEFAKAKSTIYFAKSKIYFACYKCLI